MELLFEAERICKQNKQISLSLQGINIYLTVLLRKHLKEEFGLLNLKALDPKGKAAALLNSGATRTLMGCKL